MASGAFWPRSSSGKVPTLIAPCGGCRQRLNEFAAPDTPVHLCGPKGLMKTVTMGELLPHAFGPQNLESAS